MPGGRKRAVAIALVAVIAAGVSMAAVLRHAPALYNPSPEIFYERTRGEERSIDASELYHAGVASHGQPGLSRVIMLGPGRTKRTDRAPNQVIC